MPRSRRYTDEELLGELRSCATRLGRSPTMREFELDPDVGPHPQTLVARFGSWNVAKRRAGLVARRFATKAELLSQLQTLGAELGRTPTGSDLLRRPGSLPSRSLYAQRFGSLRSAFRAAGFDVPRARERTERAIDDGVQLARRLRRVPTFQDWAKARRRDARLPSEWQVYRLFGGGRGAWGRFQQQVDRRLCERSGRRRSSRSTGGVGETT